MADATGETKEPLRVAFDRRLKLFALAYNLANFLRSLALPRRRSSSGR